MPGEILILPRVVLVEVLNYRQGRLTSRLGPLYN
jgi:hypothetical protein